MATIEKQLLQILKNNKYFKEKDTINNTTFLYIKSFPEDTGIRPLDGAQNVTRNPDLKMIPIGSPSSGTHPFYWIWGIYKNTDYQITCTLSNRGDLDITAANLEIFLLDFEGENSIFNPRVDYTAKLDLSQQMFSVHGHAQTEVRLDWNSGDYSGPMAIAARITSQSPSDLPSDWDSLNPRQERHCANFIRLWFWWNIVFTFTDASDEQESQSAYKYVMNPTSDSGGLLAKELSSLGLTLKHGPRFPKFEFTAKISNTGGRGQPVRSFQPIASRRLGVFNRLAHAVDSFFSRKAQWEYDFPKASKINLSMKPVNVRPGKNEAIAYDLIKINRKTKKTEGRVTILYTKK